LHRFAEALLAVGVVVPPTLMRELFEKGSMPDL
jgi:hypothetical protein